jgi:hemerythrin
MRDRKGVNEMPLMNWREEYRVNVVIIDQQHRKLIELLNEMDNGLKAHRGREAVGPVLSELVTQTSAHFAFEEDLMKKFGYPAYEAHRLQHQALVKMVKDFQKRIQEGESSAMDDVMNVLKQWLDIHFLGTDKQYTVFFEARGVR